MLREVLDLKYLHSGRAGAGGGGGGGGDEPHPPAPRPPRALDPHRNKGSNPRSSLPPVPSWTPQLQPPLGSSTVGVQSNNDAIVCNCGQDALLLTVRKDGPNQGRQFYKCNTGSCGFFLWADQPNQQGAHQSQEASLQAPQASQPLRPRLGFRNSPGNVGEVMCNCNEAAVMRTVQKDGLNKGRMFHTCGKPREQQCGFFQWADENSPPPGKTCKHAH